MMDIIKHNVSELSSQNSEKNESYTSEAWSSLMQMASNDAIDADKLEKLANIQLNMLEGMKSEQFSTALHQARSSIPVITKNRIVRDRTGKEMYRYTDLPKILSTISECLTNNNLFMCFNPSSKSDNDGNELCGVQVIITHANGYEWRSDWFFIKAGSKTNLTTKAQNAVGALTTAKRAALCSIFNIIEDVDHTQNNDVIVDTKRDGVINASQKKVDEILKANGGIEKYQEYFNTLFMDEKQILSASGVHDQNKNQFRHNK